MSVVRSEHPKRELWAPMESFTRMQRQLVPFLRHNLKSAEFFHRVSAGERWELGYRGYSRFVSFLQTVALDSGGFPLLCHKGNH